MNASAGVQLKNSVHFGNAGARTDFQNGDMECDPSITNS
jgi:hypothetical protein